VSVPPATVPPVPTRLTRLTRRQVLGWRLRAQQLDRPHGTVADTAVLDLGVQDTGPDGGRWALAVRGVDLAAVAPDELVTVWTLRAAPHLYRRADLPAVAAATAPFSEPDAAKRIYDAAKPLRAAGIPALAALDTVAAAMREVVTAPTVKGEVSRQLSERLDAVHLRECRPCRATHPWEMPFRLAALRAGLELEAGTSPPVLRPVPGFSPADAVPERLDVVRAFLRLLGPATPKQVAAYLDAPAAEVQARWPADAVEVEVEGERRWALGEFPGEDHPEVTRLLGPYDPYLQARDRDLLVPDRAAQKDLWRVLGRPGGVLVDGELVGSWRARRTKARVTVTVTPWRPPTPPERAALQREAERLAAFTGADTAVLDLGGG
jgi:hypothetical protein